MDCDFNGLDEDLKDKIGDKSALALNPIQVRYQAALRPDTRQFSILNS